MNAQRFLKAIVVAAILMMAVPAGAQTVSSTDIQRLQDDVYQATSDLSRLRNSDASGASRMQDELDDLRDEVTYLKVKLRKEGNVSRSDYSDVRDRLQSLRARAHGDPGDSRQARTDSSSSADPYDNQGRPAPSSNSDDTRQGRTSSSSSSDNSRQGRTSGSSSSDNSRTTTSRRNQGNIPDDAEIDVRLERELSSATAQVEDRFEATTAADLYDGNRVLIPAGSVMRGVVSSVDKATRTDRKGALTVAFDQVTVRGRDYPMRGTVTQALESEGIRGEASKIGTGSAVGAIIGGILGGVKGAVLGVLIGGGGTIAATEGKDAVLPPGTILRVRFDTPPDIR